MFGNFDFGRMNETEVRENIVAPLIGILGYRHSTENDVIAEQVLQYPHVSLGRKKKGDPLLRGKADYILEAMRKYRWVIEVKTPGAPLSDDDTQQAYSYAIHPEVKAIYYMVTNGREFRVFRSIDSPKTPPVLSFPYDDLSRQLHSIRNTLSPDALLRDYPSFKLDTGRPLGGGLRSFAKVTNGYMRIDSVTPHGLPPGAPADGFQRLVGLQGFVREGSIERRGENEIAAYLRFGAAFAQLDDISRAWGLDVMELTASAGELATDPNTPTIFSSQKQFSVACGSQSFDFISGSYQTMPFDMDFSTVTEVRTVLTGNRLDGRYRGLMNASLAHGMLNLVIEVDGVAEVFLG